MYVKPPEPRVRAAWGPWGRQAPPFTFSQLPQSTPIRCSFVAVKTAPPPPTAPGLPAINLGPLRTARRAPSRSPARRPLTGARQSTTAPPLRASGCPHRGCVPPQVSRSARAGQPRCVAVRRPRSPGPGARPSPAGTRFPARPGRRPSTRPHAPVDGYAAAHMPASAPLGGSRAAMSGPSALRSGPIGLHHGPRAPRRRPLGSRSARHRLVIGQRRPAQGPPAPTPPPPLSSRPPTARADPLPRIRTAVF